MNNNPYLTARTTELLDWLQHTIDYVRHVQTIAKLAGGHYQGNISKYQQAKHNISNIIEALTKRDEYWKVSKELQTFLNNWSK